MKRLAIVLLCFSATLSAQKIDRSKGDLKSGGSGSSSSASVPGDDDDDDDVIQGFFQGLDAGVRGLFGYRPAERHLRNTLSAYPYASEDSGNFSSDTVATNKFRLDIEDQILWSSSRLFGNHLKAKVRPAQGFYIQADYRELFERTIDNTTDNLALLHLNFCYDRLRFEKVNLAWNLGVSYVGSGVRKAGFCYGLSAEYFPGKRISFAGSAKWSKVNSRPVNTYEFQGRFHHNRFYAALGFQHLKIATPTYNFVTAGVGLYL